MEKNVVILECVKGKKGLELKAIPSQELDYSKTILKPSKLELKEGAVIAVSKMEETKSEKFYSIPKVAEIFNLNKKIEIESLPRATSEVEQIYKKYISSFRTEEKHEIDYSKYPCPTVEKHGFYANPKIWKLLVRNYFRRKNSLIVGPTGCGKTELIFHLAECVNSKIHVEDMGALTDPIPGLLGTHRIENGNSIFDYAPMVRAIQEKNMTILMDELNRCPPTANNILFPMLDSRRELPVSIADYKNSRNIKIEESVSFFATANFGFEYSGTSEIDRALQDRLMLIEIDYPPKQVEAKILETRTGIDANNAIQIVSYFSKIRNLKVNGELSTTVSTRHAIEVAELIVDGFTTVEALEFVVLPLFEGSRSEGEKCTVVNIIIAK